MTLYSAELLVVVRSPGTAWMSTLTVVGTPKGGDGRLANVTFFVSPALMRSIVLVSVIGFGVLAIVSVTFTNDSWKSPESWTAAWKARSVDAVTVLTTPPVWSFFPSGSAVTDVSALP